jgi:hypothetical protein
MADTKYVELVFDNGTYKCKEEIALLFPYINEKCQSSTKKISISGKQELFEILVLFAAKYKDLKAEDKKLLEATEILTRTKKEPAVEPCFAFLDKISKHNMPNVLGLAAQLQLAPLVNILCASLAGMINGLSAAEIRKLWGIEDDLNQKEKDEIAAENELLAVAKDQ